MVVKKSLKVITRFAPSPTGIPHIGNIRTALFDYLLSRNTKGKFILRIEDTDKARLVPGAEKAIYEILRWLGFDWDEEFKQSERLDIYKKYANELIEKELSYEEDGAVRFKMPKQGETSWIDAVGNKKITFKNDIQEDFVILKSDGFPTYNFANVIDDHIMEVTHVIRGVEFISSTPKHIQLYKAFGWEHPIFVHMPVLLGSDHQKLSKRHGAESVFYFRDQGYLKECLINFIALLGWNPGKDLEIMDINTMINIFDLKNINTGNPVFDMKKLDWMNGIYIRNMINEELKKRLLEFDSDLNSMDDDLMDKFIEIAKTRMKTLKEFGELIFPFIKKEIVAKNEEDNDMRNKLEKSLSQINNWDKKEINDAIRQFLTENNINFKYLYKILIGRESGLPVAEVFEVLGKKRSIELLS